MTLHGKTAIVTRGNTGIGKSVVLGLAGDGANVVIVSSTTTRASWP
jgi:NAD(P)-dependent dehydrogenase (short-subunit alcohol dehydrogenase family)